jgi:maltooligosyltrehalose trehalohydrolase
VAVLLRPRGRARRGGAARAARGVRLHGWDTEDDPDPQSEQTFRDSTLDWSELDQPRHVALRDWTRSLIALRRSRLDLSDGRRDRLQVSFDEDARWIVVRRGLTVVVCNLGSGRAEVPVPGTLGPLLLASADDAELGDRTVALAAESVVVAELAG